jgi:hypothetical protein
LTGVRASIDVTDVFRAAGPAYRAACAGHLSLDQLQVMSAVEHCRTTALGGHVEAGTDCGHSRIAYHSCRNRPVRAARVPRRVFQKRHGPAEFWKWLQRHPDFYGSLPLMPDALGLFGAVCHLDPTRPGERDTD